MTLPQNVKDAVGNVDVCRLETFDADWQTIKAHLMSQEAEIERLELGNIGYAQDNANLMGREHVALKRAELAESRLAAANALMGKVYTYLDRFDPNSEVYDEVESHLQGAGDEL